MVLKACPRIGPSFKLLGVGGWGGRPRIKVGFDHFSGPPQKVEILPVRGIFQVPGSKARRAGTASRGGVREGRGGGWRMNASRRGKAHQRPEARRLRVLSVLANGAERGSRPGSGFPP